MLTNRRSSIVSRRKQQQQQQKDHLLVLPSYNNHLNTDVASNNNIQQSNNGIGQRPRRRRRTSSRIRSYTSCGVLNSFFGGNGGGGGKKQNQNQQQQSLSLCWIGLLIIICLTLLAGMVSIFALGIERAWEADPQHQHHRTLLEAHRHQQHVNYDVVIAGAGPAGLTAALFAGRAGLKTLVTGSDTGQLSETVHLENFPSWIDNGNDGNGGGGGDGSGESWLESVKGQAIAVGVDFAQPGLLLSAMVKQEERGTFVLQLGEGGTTGHGRSSSNGDGGGDGGKEVSSSPVVLSRAVIVATGATQRRLGLPHEDELWGKSIHSCALCDGSAYAGRTPKEAGGGGMMTVVVVGGGDAAMDAALLLARQEGTHVILIHRSKTFRASNRQNVEQVLRSPHIQVLTQWEVEQYEKRSSITETTMNTQQQSSSSLLQAIHVRHVKEEEKTKRIECNGVFLMIGSTPNTAWLSGTGIVLDSEGLIVLHPDSASSSTVNPVNGLTMVTSVSGVFAAGEVIDNKYRQAITGAAAGAMAAIDTERWLRSQEPAPQFVKATTIPLQTKRMIGGITPDDSATDGKLLKTSTKTTTTTKTFKSNNEANTNNADLTTHHRKIAADADAVTTTSYDCNLVEQDCIESLIHKYPVVVFSKSYCPYCKKALEALSIEGLNHESFPQLLHIVQLDEMGNNIAQQIQKTLQDMTGRRTVPNVFVDGTSIGGGDETVTLHREGKLHELLVKAKAFPSPVSSSSSETTTKKEEGNNNDEDCDITTESCIKTLIHKIPVVIFTKPHCPFCRRAKELLKLEGVTSEPYLRFIDLTEMGPEKGGQVQDILLAMTGRRTVPNVFVGGTSIGGGDETSSLHTSGKLHILLQQAKAFPHHT